MEKILAIRVHDKLIELIPSNSKRYGSLFDIDSVSLLLGTNGSGKTRILVSIANAVASSQDESVQFYFQGTPNGNHEPVSPYNKKLCSIYYSALPYKRKILRRNGVINASPKNESSSDTKRLEEFGMISRTLNIQTDLFGIISYSRTVFRSILIPAIRRSKSINSHVLSSLISELDEMPLNEPSKLDSHIFIDKKRESLLSQIERFLENLIFDKLGFDDGLFFVSSLEYLYNKNGKKIPNIMAWQFLEYIGVVNYQSNVSGRFEFKALEEIVYNTRLLMNQYFTLENHERSHRAIRFRIDNIDVSKNIKKINTPIQIEWSNQSSGLQALVEQFALLDDAIGKAAKKNYNSMLLLIDEGDAYLHLDWQRKYIFMLNKYLGELKKKYQIQNLQLIMATHSPLLAADIPGDFVTSLDSDNVSNTFAAPIEEVIANAFSSNSLGEFAAANINEIYRRALLGKTTQHDRSLVDSIGDITIKTALKRSFHNDH